MKTGWLYGIAIGLVCLCACVGISQRGSYTDIAGEEAYLETILVAEMPENIAETSCQFLREDLESASHIAEVKILEEIEYHLGAGRHLAQVTAVHQGTELEVGDKIYVTYYRWGLLPEENSMERGFINLLETEKEYLVFLDESVVIEREEYPVYPIFAESAIAAAFSLEEKENVVCPVEGEMTYVPYVEVQENEFFGVNEEALYQMEALKEEMLAKYVIEKDS